MNTNFSNMTYEEFRNLLKQYDKETIPYMDDDEFARLFISLHLYGTENFVVCEAIRILAHTNDDNAKMRALELIQKFRY